VGPVVTVAPAMRCEWVSTAAVRLGHERYPKYWDEYAFYSVSTAAVRLGHERAVCGPPERATKYRDACRASNPVASMATVGFSGIRPRSVADVRVPWSRSRNAPL
jgi:hypothetical protein